MQPRPSVLKIQKVFAGRGLQPRPKRLKIRKVQFMPVPIISCLGILIFLLFTVGNVVSAANTYKRMYLLDVVPLLTVPPPNPTGKTLLVSIPKAAPGFDTPALLYICDNSRNKKCGKSNRYELKAYANSQWIDTPARMLLPLMVHHLEATGLFGAVLSAATSPVVGELRLDTEIIRLLQEFKTYPSQVRLILRVQLLDMVARQVVATRVFEVVENTRSENAEGGMEATNLAVTRLLKKLVTFLEKQIKEFPPK